MTDSPLRPAPRPAPLHDDDPRLGHPDHDLALRHVLPVVGRRRQGTDTVVLLLGASAVLLMGISTHGRSLEDISAQATR